MKLTPWYSGQTPPVREGWYEFNAPIQQGFIGGRSKFMAYYRPDLQTFHPKKNEPGYAIASFDQWRGMARNPSNFDIGRQFFSLTPTLAP
jgi:hypothetical protein